MPLITSRERVLEVFADAAPRKWVLPALFINDLRVIQAPQMTAE